MNAPLGPLLLVMMWIYGWTRAALEYRRVKQGAEWHRRKFDRTFLGKE
jgi:hypothetical protein